MLLLDLPNDILLLVAEELDLECDVSAFTKTNHRLYHLLSDFLHRNNIRHFGCTALFWGARHNRLDMIDRMLGLGADVDAIEDGQTALELAACEGCTTVVKFLVDRGATCRFQEGRPMTALCAAATEGHADVVKILLDCEEPEERRSIANIPSLPRGRQDVFLNQLFTTEGSDVDRNGVQYSIPLFMAIAGAHDATADVLILSSKVDLDYRDCFQRTPLLWALSHNRDKVVTSLLAHGADGNVQDPSTRQSPLLTAISRGNERITKLLLAHDAVDPNWRDSQQRSPLFEALWPKRNVPLLRALLTRSDLDVNCRGTDGQTPISFALTKGHSEAVELLLRYPTINVDATSDDGRTALSHASELPHVELVDLLLSNGADPRIRDQDGRAPPSYAAEFGHTKIFLRLFRSQEVVRDARDNDGRTPLSWACYRGRSEMVRLLLDLGADPNAQDVGGETPLIRTIRGSRRTLSYGAAQIIGFLLSNGADPNVRDRRGMTALSWALEYDNVRVARDLLDASGIPRGSGVQNAIPRVTSDERSRDIQQGITI